MANISGISIESGFWVALFGGLINHTDAHYVVYNCLSGGLTIEPTIFGILYFFRVVTADLVSWVVFCQHQEAH